MKLPGGVARAAAVASKGQRRAGLCSHRSAGHTFKLSDLRGKAVVLNFWATWCPPCKQEIPWFVELQKRYGSAGIAGGWRFHGRRWRPKDVAKFATEQSINYPVLLGKDSVAEPVRRHRLSAHDFLHRPQRRGAGSRLRPTGRRDEIEQNIKRVLASTAEPRS